MKTAMMNLTLGLATIISLSTLAGCIQDGDMDMNGDDAVEAESPETIAEAAQALDDPTAPSNIEYFRLRFKHTTDLMIQGQRQKATCFEPIDIGKSVPVVQRDCNSGAPGPSDMQSFYVWNPSGRTDGARMLVLAKDSSLCLHVAGHWNGSGAMDNGAALVVFTCDPARPNQWFKLDAVQPSGYSVIRATHSGRTLSIPGSSTDVNAVVFQYNASDPIAPAFFIFRDDGDGTPAAW